MYLNHYTFQMRLKSFLSKTKCSFFQLRLVILLLLFAVIVQAQPMKYASLSFSEGLKNAKKSHQILFIQLESDCDQCNSVADQGLSGEEINELFGKFLCIKTGYNTDDYKKIISDYRIFPNYPSSLFVDSNGNYLSALLNQSTTNRNEYIKLAANALANKDNPPFKVYSDALAKGKCSKELLKQYITRLIQNRFNADDLVEKYAGELTLKDLEDTTELKFLISTAPIVNSNLYRILHYNDLLYQKVFASFPEEERVKINKIVIGRSIDKAIREKDKNYLYPVLTFVRGTYGKNYNAAQMAETNFQLDFLKGTKDSAGYFAQAKRCYDWNFRGLKMDSVVKAEVASSFKRPDGAVIRGGSLYHYGNLLNNMAFSIYELSSDKEHLGFALKLSEKTLNYNYPSYMDTYARILYKLGGRKEAIDWQEKAIDLCNSIHQPSDQFKEVLLKMKNGTL